MNSVCLTFCLLLFSPFTTKTFSQPPDPSQIPEPQIAYALHATWDPDLTDNNPSICTTSGTVAVPWFHFYAGWKDGAPAFFSVDWVLIEELTNDHQPQVWYFENPQGESGFPYGCTMPPVSDPQNWNWTTWSFAPMLGFAMHNTAYRVTVQWRYGVYMKGPRGPFQTSITINVQNLVVTSPDVGRVLRWDPEKGIADTSFSYSIECAQKKQVQVTVRIYGMNRNLVYELTEQKICPGSYSFTWDGTVNTGYYEYPPEEGSNIAPAGLYTFDVEVIANPYDRDAVRSQALTVVPGPVECFDYDDGGTPDDESDDNYLYYLRWYALYSSRDASYGEIWLYDPDLVRVKTWIVPVLQCVVHEGCDGLTADPNGETHGVIIPVPVSLMEKEGTYRFVLHFYDDYADSYKNHQVKAVLEVNAEARVKGYLLVAREHPTVGNSDIVDNLISYAQKSSFVTDTIAERFGRKLIFYQEKWLKEIEGWETGKPAKKPDKVVICVTVTHADCAEVFNPPNDAYCDIYGNKVTGLRFEDDPSYVGFLERMFTRADVRIRRKKGRKLFFALGCNTALIDDLGGTLRNEMEFPFYGGFNAIVIQRDAAKWTEIFFKKATMGRDEKGNPYSIADAAVAASVEYDMVWKEIGKEDPYTNDDNRPSTHYKFYGDTSIKLVK